VTYGGDSGNRIFVLYWSCPLIRVSVIRGSTVFFFFLITAPSGLPGMQNIPVFLIGINNNFAAAVYQCLWFRSWHALSSLQVKTFRTQHQLTYCNGGAKPCAFVEFMVNFRSRLEECIACQADQLRYVISKK
jgi:hypothetical protein